MATGRGRHGFRRRFNQPTGLEPHERVLIALTDVPGEVRLSLNGVPAELRSDAERRRVADVTELLALANRLEVSVTFDPGENPGVTGGLWQIVFLEIHNEKRAGPVSRPARQDALRCRSTRVTSR